MARLQVIEVATGRVRLQDIKDCGERVGGVADRITPLLDKGAVGRSNTTALVAEYNFDLAIVFRDRDRRVRRTQMLGRLLAGQAPREFR